MADRKFARLYYDQFMEEFGEIYADDAALATWIRLLVLVEKMWPQRPEIPRSVKAAALKKLVDAKLVVVRGDTYTVRGYDKERGARQRAGRIGAAVRWETNGTANRNANASGNAMPSTSTSTRPERDIFKRPPLPPRQPAKATPAVEELREHLRKQDGE